MITRETSTSPDGRYTTVETVACCDLCGYEVDEFYIVDGDELCRDCAVEVLLDEVERVTVFE